MRIIYGTHPKQRKTSNDIEERINSPEQFRFSKKLTLSSEVPVPDIFDSYSESELRLMEDVCHQTDVNSGMDGRSIRLPADASASISSVEAPSAHPASDHAITSRSTTSNRLVDTIRFVLRDAETNLNEVALLNSRVDALHREKQ